jgi:hypothetical protein
VKIELMRDWDSARINTCGIILEARKPGLGKLSGMILELEA